MVLVVVVAGVLIGYRVWQRSGNEAVYDAVEKDRARQRAEAEKAGQPPTAVPADASNPSGSPAAAQTAGQPGTPATGATTAAAHAGRNYWTNFRGPNRDGRYDEMSVLTSWPAQGPPLLWKQPVGVGCASFIIADGRAYTIEHAAEGVSCGVRRQHRS